MAGETLDSDGKRGWVLTLNAREQHIRREKATSNICTNSGLCALAFSIHLSLLGEIGFARLAALNHCTARSLAKKLAGLQGIEVLNGAYFNEFTVRLSRESAPLIEELSQKKILAGVSLSRLFPDRNDFKDLALMTATETTTDSDIQILLQALSESLP